MLMRYVVWLLRQSARGKDMDIKKHCAFTGHRPAHFSFGYDEQHPDCVELKGIIRTNVIKLIESGVTTFLSGMALGVDIWGAEAALELKTKYPHLRLISVLPCETQAVRWSVAQRERYYDILAQCDEEVFISHRYTPSCMLDRNRYLVDHAAYLLAVYDESGKGGTAYTIKYANQKGREVIIIPAVNCRKAIDIEEVQ